jgi:hypothetical protein
VIFFQGRCKKWVKEKLKGANDSSQMDSDA